MRIFLIASLLLHLSIIYFLYSSEGITLSATSDVEVAIVENVEVAEELPTDLVNENIVASPYEKIAKAEVAVVPAKLERSTPVARPLITAIAVVKSPVAFAPVVQSISSTQLGLKPRYPRLSRMLSEQGKVIIMIHTNERGHVQKMSVTDSSGFARLDEAALEAVSNSRAVTYDKNSKIKISFSFKLK